MGKIRSPLVGGKGQKLTSGDCISLLSREGDARASTIPHRLSTFTSAVSASRTSGLEFTGGEAALAVMQHLMKALPEKT